MRILFTSLMCAPLFIEIAQAQSSTQEKPIITQKDSSQTKIVSENLPPEAQAVEVSGTKDPELKPYRTMIKGLDAFEKHRHLAPTATFRFILKTQRADTPIQGTNLRIAGDTVSTPIEIADDATFTLTRNALAEEENADLMLNRKKTSVRWRPYIRSATLQPNQLRLGDLRMECEILWAIEYDETSFFVRNLFRLAGGPCHSSRISNGMIIPNLESATLMSGERRLKIADASKDKFRDWLEPPLYDRSWDDDTLIELRFEANLKSQKN
jgi:hypothetical protein